MTQMPGTSAGPVGTVAEPADGRFVLLVDDSVELVDCMATALRAAGFAVQAAYDAGSAGKLVAARRPDAAIIDLMLPDLSGLELLREWRTNKWLGMQQVPIIVLSGRTGESDHIAAEVLGISEYVEKPADPERVIQAVRRSFRDYFGPAFRSPLTRLPGATALSHEIALRVHGESPWAALFVNLTGLNAVNAEFGYQKGDQAIQILAAILNSGDSRERQVFHVCGDTFVELLAPERLRAEAAAVSDGFSLYRGFLWDSGAGDGRNSRPDASADFERGAAAATAPVMVGLFVGGGQPQLNWEILRCIAERLMQEAKTSPKRLVTRGVPDVPPAADAGGAAPPA